MTEEEIAARTLQHGNEFKYAHGFEPKDAADRAALGICADLCDRRGIKWEMQQVDDDVRPDIVRALAAIIRAAYGVRVLDDWQQYAKEGENAQACIERHRREQDGLLKLLAQAREPLTDQEVIALLPAGWTGMLAQVMELARRIQSARGVPEVQTPSRDRATCPAHGGDYHWTLDCPACVKDARERGMSMDEYCRRVRPTLRPAGVQEVDHG